MEGKEKNKGVGMNLDATFPEASDSPIFGVHKGIPFCIRKGYVAFCAYVAIPYQQPDLIDCHGGVTWANKTIDGFINDDDLWWYGWDYGHAWDMLYFDDGVKGPNGHDLVKDSTGELAAHEWTLIEILSEIYDVIDKFNKKKGKIK